MTPLPVDRNSTRQVPVAHNHESIDLTTLEEVHRLLRDTEFATIDDVRQRHRDTIERSFAGGPAEAAPADAASMAPLPRRR